MVASVEEFDVDLDIVFAGSGTCDGADARSGTAATADDTTEVTVTHTHVQCGALARLVDFDRDLVGIVDDRT